MFMLSQSRHNLNQLLAASIVALLCILGVGALQIPQLNRIRNRAQTVSPEAFQQDVALEKLRLNFLQKTPAFGFDNVLADWVFLNFLQYFGDDDARNRTGYSLSPEYFEIIVDRDPRFLGAYIGLSTSISLYAGRPEESVALMEKGLKSMSPHVPQNAYYVWRYKGVDELLFLGDTQAARQSFEKAAEWASTYSDEESQYVAALSRKTAQFLARNPKSKSAQVIAWTMVLNYATDDRTQKIAISRIEALGGKVTITPEGKLVIQAPRAD
jgi:tetratricopeptide (TPR) repeat protein